MKINLKSRIFLISCFFLFYQVKAQDLKPFFKSNLQDNFMNLFLVDSILYGTKTISSSIDTLNNNSIYQYNIITGEEREFIIDQPQIGQSNASIFLVKPDTIKFFKSNFINEFDGFNLNNINYCDFLVSENQIVSCIEFETLPDSINSLFHRELNYDNNFVTLFSFISSLNEYRMIEFNANGEIEKILELPFPGLVNFKQLPDSNYLVNQQFNGYIIVDKSLESFEYFPLNRVETTASMVLLSDSVFLTGGRRFNSVLNGESFYTEILLKINAYTYEIDTIFESTEFTTRHPGVLQGYRTLDRYYENQVFFSNNIDACMLFSNFQDPNCYDYISVHLMDEAGNVKWSKLFGGDANYYPLELIATPDSGMFLTTQRINFDETPFTDLDIYYLKLDKNGNVEEDFYNPITSVNNLEIPEVDVLVFPNPSDGFINFKFSSTVSNPIFKLYDGIGKLVYTNKIEYNNLNLNQISTGIYFYLIEDNDRIIKRDKLIIE